MVVKEPVHPGFIVLNAFKDRNVSVTAAAAALHVSRSVVTDLINGDIGISPEMAVRLSKTIGGTISFWMHLQMDYDLGRVERWADMITVTPLTSCNPHDLREDGAWLERKSELASAPLRREHRPGVWREGGNSLRKTVKR